MKLVFLGGLFAEQQKKFIGDHSRGVMQTAAHVFQSNLLEGLDAVLDDEVELINLPFVGSYPLRFDRLYFPSCEGQFRERTRVIGVGFCNLVAVKHISRFFSAFAALFRIKRNVPDVILIYSMHLPFILAATIARRFFCHTTKICLVVPDLPEYMSDQSGYVYKILKKIDTSLMNFCLSSVDCYVLLTDAMSEKLAIRENDYIVVEGVVGSLSSNAVVTSRRPGIIFYSGTLASRYGICEFIEQFMSAPNRSWELWICGEGDSKEYIVEATTKDPRVKYLGQLPREKVLEIQATATILINPRPPEGEYTKYSFPSKIMEYMVSGRPVVMHRLEGVPEEYFDYCYTPAGHDAKALMECLQRVLELPQYELDEMARRARSFVFNNKSSVAQALKIKIFLLEKINEK